MNRKTYWLSPELDNLAMHDFAQEVGLTRAVYVRPSLYVDFSTGIVDLKAAVREFRKLVDITPPWVPLAGDLERNNWVNQGGSGPLPAWAWMEQRRLFCTELRDVFYNRIVNNWSMQRTDNPLFVAHGWDTNGASKSLYTKQSWPFQQWEARRRGNVEQASEWKMPLMTWLSPANWATVGNRNRRRRETTLLTGEWWAAQLDLANELGGVQLGWFTQPNALFSEEVIRGYMQAFAERGGAG